MDELATRVFDAVRDGKLADLKQIFSDISPEKRQLLLQKKAKNGNQLIHKAALCGWRDIVEYLVADLGCDVDARGYRGMTPLMTAAAEDHTLIVKFLLEKNVDLNAEDSSDNGSTAIHWAASMGSYDSAKMLLQKSPNIVDKRDKRNRTPLFLAASGGTQGHMLLARHLLETYHFLDLSHYDNETGAHFIHVASKSGNVEIVKTILAKKIENGGKVVDWIEMKDFDGRTPLFWAASSGSAEVVRFLVQQQADLDVHDKKFGALAIHLAAISGDVPTVTFLLSLRPDWLEVKDKQFGRTPFICAAEGGNVEFLQFLLDNKVDINVRDTANGELAIHWAAKYGNAEAVKFLLSIKSDWLEAKSNDLGRTPLIFAASSGNVESVKFLIEIGAKVDAVDNGKTSALHVAACNGRTPVVAVLISANLELAKLKRLDGLTALDLAKIKNHVDIVKLLSAIF